MIISIGARRASVIVDEPTAVYERVAVKRQSIAVPQRNIETAPLRATVEILRHGGGLMPRALLGGSLSPSADGVQILEVNISGSKVHDHPTCTSQLATPLSPGLPDEFATAVLDGIIRRACFGGRMIVDRAAFDAVESSPSAFGLAAELLATVLAVEATEGDVARAVREAITAWP